MTPQQKYYAGMMARLDGKARSGTHPRWLAGHDYVGEVRRQLQTGATYPGAVRFIDSPGVTGGGQPFDSNAYAAGEQAAKSRQRWDARRKDAWQQGYSNRLLHEAYRAV